VRPTRPTLLLALGVAAVPVAWTVGRLLDAYTGTPPSPSWLTVALLLLLGAVLEAAGRRVDRWRSGEQPVGPGDALRMARIVALAKAGSVFGALVAGGALGLAVVVLDRLGTPFADGVVLRCMVTAAAGVLVSVLALRLERRCRLPDDEDGVALERPA
jgi:peptidoglycan/LPS O-acetylase OafA/YrhL